MKYQKPIIVLILCLIFTTLFLYNTKRDFSLIFKKDLLAHDESSNSVVAANITRKFFPPMVRVNPLNVEQGNWMEGPYWQHIPPLFTYVPYVFFKLDGQVTIEVKRLAYAFVVWLTGLVFICGVYRYRRSLAAAVAATLATIFWINTPFTHELITGYAFGTSDIVLAFTVVCSFVSILWYLKKQREERLQYRIWKIVLISIIVALPIMAKNLLGAIPAATFFILLLRDYKFSKKLFIGVSTFLVSLVVYYLPFYFVSPQTFNNEILVSLLHFKKLEGWDRPGYYYITNYLPQRYLFGWTWVFFVGLALGVGYRVWGRGDRKDKVLLTLSGGWFVWNLIAISLVTSKVPNFIYQSYLLSLFFIVYSVLTPISNVVRNRFAKRFLTRLAFGMVALALVASIGVTGYEIVRFGQQFNTQRAQAYSYETEREKFYGTAEELQRLGLNTQDIVIVRVSDNDCWFRYPIIFLTGAESKTLLEISFGYDAYAIKNKYDRMYFLTNKTDRLSQENPSIIELANYTLYQFDLEPMSPGAINDSVANFLAEHREDIAKDIIRTKKDKTSCQWLVPDPILNAP